MDWARCRKLMWHWSLLTTASIATFWAIWSIFAPVPVVDSIQITNDYSWQLPFPISRWWDILIGPICSVMIIGICYVTRHPLARDISDWKFVLVLGLVEGLFLGLAGLALGSVLGLAYGLVGLASGLIFGLIFGLALELILGLVWLVYRLAEFLAAVGDWLTAKN